MPLHDPSRTRKTTITRRRTRTRFSVPRGLIAGTFAATALVWGPYAVIPGSSRCSRWGRAASTWACFCSPSVAAAPRCCSSGRCSDTPSTR